MMEIQESLCRLCLKQSNDAISLFAVKNGHLVASLVKIICPIEINKNEALPSKVCSDCFELIVDAIHLRDISLMNDEELRRNAKLDDDMNKVEEEEIYIEALEEALVDQDLNASTEIVCEFLDVTPTPEATKTVKNSFCELCDTQFANTSSFKRHQLRKHRNVEYFCDQCQGVYKTKHDIEQHMKKHHQSRYRDVKFLYSEKLGIDVSEMFEKLDEPIGLSCTFCSFTDSDEDVLHEHLQSHQDVVDSGKMYCLHCPQQILTMNFMIAHTRSHNEKIKTHRCLICNKTFPYDEKFLSHLRNHKKNQHKICFCEKCGRKFSKPRLMEDHIRFIHNKESLFCCPECGQGFGSKSALNGHIKRHVEGNKYQCPFCPKAFSSHNLLNSHKVVHSTDRVSKTS